MKSQDNIQEVIKFLNQRDLRGDAQKFHGKFKSDIETAMRAPRESGLRRLADQIEKAKLDRVLFIDSFDNPRIPNWLGESVLDFGDEKFIIKELIGGEGFKKNLYWSLNDALRTGEFAALKKCRWRPCSKFFASYRRGAFACSPECNTKFHNSQGRKTGYFADRYQQEKDRKLEIARKLKGKPLDVIMKRSRLTKLALIRAGILEEQE